MKSRPSPSTNKGYALIMVMIFLGTTLLVLGSVMFWANANSSQIRRNNVYFSSQAAAEAATEQVIANMNRDYLHQSLNSAASYETNIPSTNGWPIGYVFSSTNTGANSTYVYIAATSTSLTPLGSQWSGLQGYPTLVAVTSTATPQNQLYTVPATVTETNQYADIPIFQFAIFYNMNLEIQPGSAMSIGGPVFCNDSIWAASTGLTFSNKVTAAGTINSNNISDPFMTSGAKNGSGNPDFMGAVTTNHAQLNLPVGTNTDPASVEAILQFPPSAYALGTSAAYTTNGLLYLANQASLIITNTSSGGTNISVFWQDGSHSPAITQVPYNYYLVTNTSTHNVYPTNVVTGIASSNIIYWGYSFVTNVNFYDYRESDVVQGIQIDVAQLGAWINNTATNGGSTINQTILNDTGQNIDSIYVYNSVPLSSTTLPGVRLVNGQQLPTSGGLALATPDPIYVKGDFNTQINSANSDANLNQTTYTYPAALYGDALTILSSNWSDAYPLATRTPIATTVNAATLEGIVQSSGSNYSGGVENFLRLLEAWSSSIPLYYNGSIVVMFPSQYATNTWDNSSYYGVPDRHWAFDLNFTQAGGLPPMTPRVKGIIRQGWQ